MTMVIPGTTKPKVEGEVSCVNKDLFIVPSPQYTMRRNSRQSRRGGLLALPVVLVHLFLALLVILYILATLSFAFYPYLFYSSSSSSRGGESVIVNTSSIQRQHLARTSNVHGATIVGADKNTNPQQQQHSNLPLNGNNKKRTYEDWKQLAIQLARLPARELLQELRDNDPFGTRTFEEQLLQEETRLGRILQLPNEIQALFPCPGNDNRITYPDQRNLSRAVNFRNGMPGTFLFFQHLRKAGGTNFCTLAKQNLPRNQVAAYFCMSDWDWFRSLNQTMAGYLHHWTNQEIMQRMKASGHRVTGNEWDNFDREHFFDMSTAIFATSFRRPLDRALSQFRFECVEDRGCLEKDVGKWWKQRRDLYNIYTVTFADIHRYGMVPVYEGNTVEHQERRAQIMADALDTVAKFHLVLSMEWLAYAEPQVKGILGFSNTKALTERVRPHIVQAKRQDGQEVNKLGAAGIAAASWTPEEYLTAEQYKDFAEYLALDELLTDAARRMFLERAVCDSFQ